MTTTITRTPPAEAPQLYRSATGAKLHVPGCPHVHSTPVAASPDDVEALEVCDWCRKEIDGVGRTYYSTALDGMRAFGCHEGTHRPILEAVRSVERDQVWLPHSESYVALGLAGRGVAWIGKGYVFVAATGVFTELPGYRASREGGRPQDERLGDLCLRCFVTRGLNGSCDTCD